MQINSRSNKLFLAVFGLALCAGCASYTPKPLFPLKEYEAIRLRSSMEQKGSEKADAELFGFSVVSNIKPDDGLSLAEANTLALFYAPKILERRREFQIAGAILLEAGLPENPGFFIGPRWSTEDSGLILPGSLSFKIPLVDEHGPKRESAKAELTRSKWLLLDREIEVLAELQKQSVQLSALAALEEISKLQVQRSEELVAWAESLYSGGEIDSFSLQVAQRASEQARTEHMETMLERKRLKRELFVSLGLFPDAAVLFNPQELSLLTLFPRVESKDNSLAHPTLKALEAEYRSAEEALKAEVRSQYPHLSFGPEYEGDRGEPTVGFGLAFEIPLFAQNDTAIALAESKRDSIRGQYQVALLNLLKRYANLQDELAALDKRLEELDASAVREARELDRVFSSTLASADQAVLEALSAASSLAETLSEEILIKERRDLAHIDILLISGSLIPEEFTIDEKISGGQNE